MSQHAWAGLSHQLIDDIYSFLEQLSETKTPTVHTGNFAKLKAQELERRLAERRIHRYICLARGCDTYTENNYCEAHRFYPLLGT
jgi:hypothetical protein